MEKSYSKLKHFFKTLGPGFISGAADDDPTAIAAYTQAGAQFGYHQLWTALYTIPFMTAIQIMCGRIGLVTGKGLAGVIRSNYSRKALYFAVVILLVANVINIGADLGAMAASAQLIFNFPFAAWLIGLTVITLLMEVFISYRIYAQFLKYLGLTLLVYVGVAFLIKQDWSSIGFATFVPYISLDKAYILNLAAILGTNISPYLFFWQADEEVEEEVEHHKIKSMGRGVPKVRTKDIEHMNMDTGIGMFFSNLIVLFIAIAAASTLGRHGIMDISTPAQAAQALAPLAGNFSALLFTLGIVASGLLAVPVLAGSASYALSETFKWREGLYRKWNDAHGFYGVITIATLIGLLINFTSIPPFRVLIYSAALNAVLAPPLLIFILMISNSRKIMGERVNSKTLNFLGIFITLLISLASLALIFYLLGVF